MRYALNIKEDGQILSATYKEYATENMILVDELPEGNIADYKYIDGEYIYNPLPSPIEPIHEPTLNEVINALLGVTE
jgi:hypothetical protein